MLIYHPAFDASHCTFRILKIFNILPKGQYIEEDRIKIIDFYIVFPKKIKFIRFPKNVKSKYIRKSVESINDSYRPCKNQFLMAKKMSFIQEKVLQVLAINEYLIKKEGSNEYTRGEKYSQLALSIPILNTYISNEAEILIFDFLLNYELNGKDGLKDRTTLMEFRYDK